MTDDVLWQGRGTDRYHATRSCAGHEAVPVLPEVVVDSDAEPCGVCQPDYAETDSHVCDDCGNSYVHEGSLFRHRVEEHIETSRTPDERVERHRELDEKARGETA